MERALKREIEDTYKDTIIKRLVETHHFDLPETLVERELETIIRQHVQQQKGGAKESPGQEELTHLRQEHRNEAARRVKIGLVLETIAEKEGLTVTQDDLNAEIMRLASDLKMPADDLVKMIKAGGQESINELRNRTLADKALDFVYRHAVIQG
jgi:trigger factor